MNYKVIPLDSIDVSDMLAIKQRNKWYGNDDHSRWVFKDSNTGLYYKLWNESYIRKDNVQLGLDRGFYDKTTVPAFHGIIYHNDICRGYVTQECQHTENDSSIFYEIIKKKTHDTHLFVYDFTEKHIMEFKDNFTLIDLEGICELYEYEDIAQDKNHAAFASEKYRRFVNELCKN